ncbi:hypothetical protein FRC12_017378 [Ceratobasidium sp. 428]|nr:hypothetical protein FRC12_017378 [Ceratobasidium sp. 428]
MSSRSIAGLFDDWKTAHDCLTRATQSFFDTCVALLQVIDESPTSFARDRSIEEVVIGVYNRTEPVSTAMKQLRESQVIVRRINNTSTKWMPINVLPPELMSRIFALVVSSSACTGDESYLLSTSYYERSYITHPLVTIPSVCTRWRQLATGTPSLWSHVDIQDQLRGKKDMNVLPRTRFWLERARDVPLSLHIGNIYQESGNGSELLSLLKPHITNLYSLMFSGESGAYFWSILHLYAEVCPLGSLASLSLRSVKGDGFAVGPFTWPTNALRGLTSLHIGGLPLAKCPSMDQLVNMLTNSPALHTLKLWSSRFAPLSGGRNCPEVDLPCLRRLRLDYLLDYTLTTLLNLLMPGPLELDVGLLLGSKASSESYAAVLSFLKRTNIFCLSLRGVNTTRLAEQLGCVPKLRMLELIYETGETCANLGALTVPGIMTDKFDARCPSLQLLWINGSHVDSETYIQLQRIVSCHYLNAIVFGDRTVIHNPIRKTMVEWLRERVKSVACYPMRSFGSVVGRE